MRFRAECVVRGDSVVVKLFGEMDMAVADEALTILCEAAARGPLILDLAELSFLDSSGLRVLLSMARTHEQGVPVRIVHAQPHVRAVFSVSGTEGAFEFLDDPEGDA